MSYWKNPQSESDESRLSEETATLEDLEAIARRRGLDGTERARASAVAMYSSSDSHRARAQRLRESAAGEFDARAAYQGRKNGSR